MKTFSRWPGAAFAALMLLLLGGGAWFYQARKQDMRETAFENLQAIAQLKTNQIAQWQTERLSNVEQLAESAFLLEGVERFLVEPGPEITQKMLARFRSIQKHAPDADVLLVDAGGRIRLGLSGQTGALDEDAARELSTAFRDRRPVLGELNEGPGGLPPHIDAVAPFFAGPGAKGEPVAAIILRGDPRKYLYPLIETWPTPSRSAETLVVRREGGEVLFLNPLRHLPGAALKLRVSLTRDEVPAVMAAKGLKGPAFGKDYRGVEVLSVLKAIPDSSWFLVAKMDAEEALAAWNEESTLILALILGLALIFAAVMGVVWQRNTKAHYRVLYRAEAAQNESERRYAATLTSIGDGVIVTGADGHVTLMNPVAEALTGWSFTEAQGKPIEEIFRIVNEETRQAVENPARRVIQEGMVVGLANHTLLIAKDGVERAIADSGAPVRNEEGEIIGIVLVFRDQTAEREARKKLEQKEARYRDLVDHIGSCVAVYEARDNGGDFIILEFNKAAEKAENVRREEILGRSVVEVFPGVREFGIFDVFQRVWRTGVPESFPVSLYKDERIAGWRDNYVYKLPSGEVVAVYEDVTERKQAEHRQKAAIDILRMINDQSQLRPLARAVTRYLQDWSGCEAVGLRLKDGDDYPYFETRGFPAEFVEAENSLCERDLSGQIRRDEIGSPMLECMCGNILRGRFDPRKPFFTKQGSFYSNCTTKLLASTTEADRQARTRNRCNGEGYESVALIALRHGGDVIGLLQFNDKRRDRFTPELIEHLEHLADSLATALAERRAEAALRESEEKHRILADNLLFGVGISSGERVLWANRAMLKLFGYDNLDEFLKIPLLEHVAPASREWIADRIRRAKAGEPPLPRFTYEIIRKDGEIRVMDAVSSSIVFGAEKCSQIVLSDVTEHRRMEEALLQSEAKYRALVENANSVILRMDQDGNVLFINEYAQGFFGYREEEIINRNVVGTIVPETDMAGRNMKKLIANICGNPEKYKSNENENICRNGKRVWISWTNSLIPGEAGKGPEVLCIGNDITEQRQAEIKVRKLEEQINQSAKMEAIGELAGGIAHDFNNLLMAIIGHADLLRINSPADGPTQKIAGNIENVAERAADLARQLLSFARKQRPKNVQVNICPLLLDLAGMLSRTINKNIVIETRFIEENPVVLGDPTQIHQVFLNLALNARDAMPNGGRLTFTVESVEQDNQRKFDLLLPPSKGILVSVADTGQGIPKEIQSKIFEPFFTTKDIGKGTGMGLATAYGIVKSHGGALLFDSESGKGTTFKVFLPVCEETVVPPQTTPGEEIIQGTGRILVVDDETVVREVLKEMLEQLGYQVVEAGGGNEAVAYFREHHREIDAVILDMMMPEMDGKECFSLLQAIRPDVKVILSSGFSLEDSVDALFLNGLLARVQKPYRLAELSKVLAKIREKGNI